jgi:hypothetical protein
MNGSVVVIAIGPVQGFIRAARRTADLYEGSRLLVELARAPQGRRDALFSGSDGARRHAP